jgi:hypothetical protein
VGSPVLAEKAAPRHPAAEHPAQGPAAARDDQDSAWTRLQSQFVDDPVAAVRGASDLVERAVQELLRRSDDKDTEELRSAFLRYRDLHRTLTN